MTNFQAWDKSGYIAGEPAKLTVQLDLAPLVFPNENTTGPTPNLPLWTGGTQFRTAGQVIEGVEIQTSTGLYIAPSAAGMVFRNVRFVYTGALNAAFTLINNQAANVTFDRCEFDGRSNTARAVSGTGTGLTARYCNVHHTGNAFEISGPFTLEGNYIHDIYTPAGQGWHADGIQVPAGPGNDGVVVRGNTIILTGTETSCVSINGNGVDQATNVLIENNLIAGGGYSMYVYDGANVQVLNNRFSTRVWPKVGKYGLWYPGVNLASIVRQGNVIHETGQPCDA